MSMWSMPMALLRSRKFWINGLMIGLMTLTTGFFATGAEHVWGEQDSVEWAMASPYRAGVQAYREGHYTVALTHLKQAEGDDPYNPNVRYYLAIVLDKLARSEEAAPHYQFVAVHGTDAQVVAYSKKRLESLNHDEPSPLTRLRSKEGVAIPLKPHQNALMVEATLNDHVQGTFIVDTGATYTSISQELYEQLGPENLTHIGTVRITTANGRIDVPKVLIDRVSINGLEARNIEATVIDVRQGSSFSGLLGLSFIRQFKITIDPSQGHLVFQAI